MGIFFSIIGVIVLYFVFSTLRDIYVNDKFLKEYYSVIISRLTRKGYKRRFLKGEIVFTKYSTYTGKIFCIRIVHSPIENTSKNTGIDIFLAAKNTPNDKILSMQDFTDYIPGLPENITLKIDDLAWAYIESLFPNDLGKASTVFLELKTMD